jgi:CubicO group peptidase (beta-lactamase class C family)
MKRWSEFAAERPDMAEAGHTLIYQFRVGLGYLATVRKDGGPRVHPVCPVVAKGGLYTRHYTDSVSPLSIFQADPLEHEPGTRFLHSTHGFNLVGAVVEAAGRERFPEYVRRHVFTPSRMRHAQVDDITIAIPDRATGYDPVAGGGVTEAARFDPTNKITGGSFMATAEDMTHYAIAVMTDRLLRPETTAAMWTRQTMKDGTTTAYGLGWTLGWWGSERTASHAGGQPGATTLLLLAPDRRCGVVVLTNLGGVKGMSDLARGIAGAACR